MTHLNDISKIYLEQVASKETQEEGYKPIDKEKENKMYRRAGNLARTSLSARGKKKEDAQDKSSKIVSAITRQKENERFAKMGDERARSNYREEVEQVDEDSRRMSNKQHTKRVRSNIKSFGSNYTPPSNYDPDANRGQGEVLTRKQIEKKRRKALRQEEVEQVDEADSLAAMAARREKRLARQRKQMGTSSTGQDFGHDYGISSAERKKRQKAEFDKFVGKKTQKEALDPVGKEDADVDNDGKKNTKSDKYLLNRRKAIGKAMKEAKHATAKQMHSPHEVPTKDLKGLVSKAVKRIDTDVDGDTDNNDKAKGELGEFVPGVGNKRLYSSTKTTTAKESFSNWRQDLTEIMTDDDGDKPIKEKKVNNKIKINPKLGEAVEEIGGTLIEMIEIDEFDVVLESVYDELIAEGHSEDEVEYGIETALSTLDEASDSYYDSAVAASKAKAAGPKKSMKDRLKSAAKKAIMGTARAVGKVVKAKSAVQAAPGRAKAKARSVADRVKAIAKKGYEQGRGPVEKKNTYRGAGVGRKEKIGEATEDSLKDRRMERGGLGGNQRYDRAPKAPNTKKFGTGKTAVQKELEKKYGKNASAMDIVKAEIRAKHGKGAIKD